MLITYNKFIFQSFHISRKEWGERISSNDGFHGKQGTSESSPSYYKQLQCMTTYETQYDGGICSIRSLENLRHARSRCYWDAGEASSWWSVHSLSERAELSRADSCREVEPRPLLVAISLFLLSSSKECLVWLGDSARNYGPNPTPRPYSQTTPKRPFPFPLSLLQPYSLHRCLPHCEIKMHYSHPHPHIQPIYQWSNLPKSNKIHLSYDLIILKFYI